MSLSLSTYRSYTGTVTTTGNCVTTTGSTTITSDAPDLRVGCEFTTVQFAASAVIVNVISPGVYTVSQNATTTSTETGVSFFAPSTSGTVPQSGSADVGKFLSASGAWDNVVAAPSSNTLVAASAAITSTVGGVAASLTPATGTIQDTIGFNAAGALVKAVMPSAGIMVADGVQTNNRIHDFGTFSQTWNNLGAFTKNIVTGSETTNFSDTFTPSMAVTSASPNGHALFASNGMGRASSLTITPLYSALGMNAGGSEASVMVRDGAVGAATGLPQVFAKTAAVYATTANVGEVLTLTAVTGESEFKPVPSSADIVQTALTAGNTNITAWGSVVLVPTQTANITLTYPDHTTAIGKTIKVIRTGVPNAFTVTHTPTTGAIGLTNAGGELNAANGAITLESVDAGSIRQVSNSIAAATATVLTSGRVNASVDLPSTGYVASGIGTKVPFNAVVYTNGVTVSGTDGIVPAQTGRYRCSWYMMAGSTETDDSGWFRVVQNNVSIGRIRASLSTTAGMNQISAFVDVQLTSGVPVYLYFETTTAAITDSISWAAGSYFDVSQLPVAIAPVVNTVAEYGSSSITDGQTLLSPSYVNVPSAIITLPSAGVYNITYGLNVSHSASNTGVSFAVTDVSADPLRIVSGSQTRITSPAVAGSYFVANKSFRYTATGATTLYLMSAASGGTTTFYNAAGSGATNANSALIYVKIAGQTSFIGGLTTLDQTANGYFDIGDMRMMWGKHSDLNVDTTTVTLPAAFADNSYIATVTCSSGIPGSLITEAFTTTSFDIDRASTTTVACIWSYICIGKRP